MYFIGRMFIKYIDQYIISSIGKATKTLSSVGLFTQRAVICEETLPTTGV